MSLGLAAIVALSAGFPRVSGDEPPSISSEAGDEKFSPRERG